jgi:hypothetical protein
MRWLDSLERRFGSWTIPHFPLFLVSANGLIYLMGQAEPAFVSRLILDPAAIRAGEFWRTVTFLFVPPMMNPIFLVFWLLLLYQYASALEHAWGEFRFLMFYAVGALATVLTALLVLHEPLGNVPLNTTLFLAFATLFPDFQLLFFFIIPMRVKYLAWGIWILLGGSFLSGSFGTRVAIAASLLNYALFFGQDIWQGFHLRWEVYRNRRRLGAGKK